MSKILISFLGTGPAVAGTRAYRKAKYSFNGAEIGESSFVFSLLMDYFCFDDVILIGTVKSMWEAVYLYLCEKNNCQPDDNVFFSLANTVESASHLTAPDSINLQPIRNMLSEKSAVLTIPYGLNRIEQLNIFARFGEAFKKIESGDELVLDVTHSFRSLPLFATSVIHYFQSLSDKDIKLEKVYYGMLDAMREFNNVAPIVDISTTIELQRWSNAAHSFKEYGKGSSLAKLLGGLEGDMIQLFSNAVNINYLNEIKMKLANFQVLAKSTFNSQFASWVVPEVLNAFVSKLQKTGNRQWLFQFELSLWHRVKQNYASAYIVFVESIVTFVCELNSWEPYQKRSRDNAKIEISKKKALFSIKKIYNNANNSRNNAAHSLSRRVNLVNKDIENLEKLQSEFFKIASSSFKIP